jgi:hypothetical protein
MEPGVELCDPLLQRGRTRRAGGNKCLIAGSAGTRFPCASRIRVPSGVRAAHSVNGAMPPLRASTKPPPKCATSVNECVSPPRFSVVTPRSASVLTGLKRHLSDEPVAVTSAMKSGNVLSPSPTHAGGPVGESTALNDVGSQSSRSCEWWAHQVGALRVRPHGHDANGPPRTDRGVARGARVDVDRRLNIPR